MLEHKGYLVVIRLYLLILNLKSLLLGVITFNNMLEIIKVQNIEIGLKPYCKYRHAETLF